MLLLSIPESLAAFSFHCLPSSLVFFVKSGPRFFHRLILVLKLVDLELGGAHLLSSSSLFTLLGVNLPLTLIVPLLSGLFRIFRIFIFNPLVIVDSLLVIAQSLKPLSVGTRFVFFEGFKAGFSLLFLLLVRHAFDITPSLLHFVLSDLEVVHRLLVLGS